jgi:hypothetical protein
MTNQDDTTDDRPKQTEQPTLKDLLLAPTPRCDLDIPARRAVQPRKWWTGSEPFDDEPHPPK